MCDLGALGVCTEDIDGLSELLGLEDDALEDLRVGVHVEDGEVGGLFGLFLEILLQSIPGLSGEDERRVE